jgi:hypothetical protein
MLNAESISSDRQPVSLLLRQLDQERRLWWDGTEVVLSDDDLRLLRASPPKGRRHRAGRSTSGGTAGARTAH